FGHGAFGFGAAEGQLRTRQLLLAQRGIRYVGPESYAPALPLLRSLYFQDPDGHTVEACVRSAGSDSAPSGGTGPVRPLRISHARVEVTDVPRSARWYQDVLGFQPLAERDGQVYL